MSDFDDQDDRRAPQLQRTGTRLALAGYVPFAVLAVWLYSIPADHPWRPDTILLLKTYGAVILSFLGGIRFGIAVAADEGEQRGALTLSIVPALAGWAALWISEPYAFALLAVAFAAHGAWDSIAAHSGAAPAWFGRMRSWLTILVVIAMVLAFLATA
ncbi:MAG: DUF3429 domain-containing protein [Mesorhizobium sp.]|nr:DUF3429 domain-containing protein [Mesorhizobium sp.]